MTTYNFPLETDRLELRLFRPSDLDAVADYFALPEVQRYLDWKVRDRKDVKSALKNLCGNINLQRPGDAISLAIVDKDTDLLIGQVTLRWQDATAGQAEIRFVINPKYKGQGFATEAVRAVIDAAFEQYRIHRVFARCDARNNRSAKLLRRLGMRLEAHYREHALFQGEWDEELHFAILDREWKRSDKVRELHHRIA